MIFQIESYMKLTSVLSWYSKIVSSYVVAKCKRNPFFVFNGTRLRYFIRTYNHTWLNERHVEIPIVRDYMERFAGKSVLEIGNVMRHYMPEATHIVVDKYEQSPGVTNCDIVDYEPPSSNAGGFDLIISISTFEHIGFNESIYSKTQPNTDADAGQKLKQAIDKTKSLLSPGGVFIMTAPLGYNKIFDGQLANGQLGFTRQLFMQRTGVCEWRQYEENGALLRSYNKPYPNANGLVVGIYENNDRVTVF